MEYMEYSKIRNIRFTISGDRRTHVFVWITATVRTNERCHATTFPRFNSLSQMVISSYSLFLRIFHFPFSFNSIYFYLGWFWAPSKAYSGVYHAILGHIGNREVFRRSGNLTVNTVTLNGFYNVSILWPKNVFPKTWCMSLQCLIHHCDCFQQRWTFEKLLF